MKSQYQIPFAGTTLAAFLQNNTVFYRPDLFTITLASGQVLNTTSHQTDLLLKTSVGTGATRIQTTGGTNVLKYFYPAGTSANGTVYVFSCMVKNQGLTAVQIHGNIIAGPIIQPGDQQQVSFLGTGDGVGQLQLRFHTANVADAMDVIAINPVIAPFNGGANLIASGNLNFVGWSTFSGSAATLTQSQPVPTNTKFFSSSLGNWTRGPIMSTNDATQVEEMSLTVACDLPVLFPGSNTPLLQTVASSIFDRARVTVQTAYLTQNFNPNNLSPAPVSGNFVATKFVGDIVTSADPLTTTNATFKVSALTYLLQEAWPQRVIQSGCTYALFDRNCNLNKASYLQSRTVAAGSTALILNLNTALPNAAPYYDNGFVTFISGQNAGLSMAIAKQLSTTQLQLSAPYLLPISTGDAFSIYPGCDKTLATCATKFSNAGRFSGAPNVPEPERAVQL